MPPDEVLKDFKINGDFVLEVDGEVLRGSEIFFSERAVAYLVMAPDLSSPIMISPRTRTVESVHLMKVMKKNGGASVDILADAELTPISSFKLQDSNVVFTLNDKTAKLKPKPWLLGLHKGDRLKEHNPEYAFGAAEYTPAASYIEALRGIQKDVRVRVYFGSWCPHCKRIVPRILRVADELEESRLRFEYYGLPSPFGDEPEAVRAGIHSVPTVVVFIGGEEAAQLSGDDLNAPEAALRRTVGESS
jgi:thiol-disulfide isomerase/thioredoxin